MHQLAIPWSEKSIMIKDNSVELVAELKQLLIVAFDAGQSNRSLSGKEQFLANVSVNQHFKTIIAMCRTLKEPVIDRALTGGTVQQAADCLDAKVKIRISNWYDDNLDQMVDEIVIDAVDQARQEFKKRILALNEALGRTTNA